MPLLESHWQQQLARRRAERQQAGRWRALRESHQGADFTTNDYLGLSQHPDVLAAAQAGIAQWGTGAGGSPLLNGYLPPHRELAAELASFLGWPRVLLFSSGFQANLALLQVLQDLGLKPLLDRQCHASLYAGASSRTARVSRFRHNDLQDLQRQLERHREPAQTFVVTEGVFSMSGARPPLAALRETIQGSAGLVIDDAHGLGVTGATGRGVMDELAAADLLALTGTFGKALGHSGAFIATHPELADWLVNEARPFIYSTAMPPAEAVSITKALQLIQTDAVPRSRLHAAIELFCQQARQSGLPFRLSRTPIQALVTGSEQRTMELSQRLAEQGFWLPAIRPPTVARNRCQLRITLHSHLSQERIMALVQALAKLWPELPHE